MIRFSIFDTSTWLSTGFGFSIGRSKARPAFLAFCVVLVPLCLSVQAQQVQKTARIGYLSTLDAARDATRTEAIQLGLRELGYTEGENIAFEYRYAEGKFDRYAELAAELVRLKVDIIVVSGGTLLIREAQKATKTIPSLWRALHPILSTQAWWKA
jgi:ABC-type uncharacterized transport system substrate-binding protein